MEQRFRNPLGALWGNYKFHAWFLIINCFTIFLFYRLLTPAPPPRYELWRFSVFIPVYFTALFYLFFRVSRISIDSERFLLAILLMVLNYIVVFAYFFRSAGLYATHCLPSDSACPAAVIYDGVLSLYFSAITLTTVGYGDFIPANNYGRLFASIEALSGYFVLATIIAVIMRRIHNLHK